MRLVTFMEHIKNIKAAVTKTPNALVAGMRAKSLRGTTENGAETYISTDSALLDFYSQAGAMRPRPAEALKLFKKAFAEDEEKAMKILFYLRDVRGGQGERDLFRMCLEWLGNDQPAVFEKVVQHVPEYGRWDDLFFDNEKAMQLVADQLEKDAGDERPSLLAKWLPTINASSAHTRAKANVIAAALGMTGIEYRKMVRAIRAKIRVVEEFMSANKWKEIEYSHVPSQASRIYKDAFKKHDEARYSTFIDKAEKGEVKINAATLYPYQIYKSVESNYSKTLETLWNQLPDYTQGKNALVIADVSGSMTGDPMSVSVSLALYFAERNKGPFKDYFMTFTSDARLQKVVGASLQAKMTSIERADWHDSTDLQSAFDLILSVATEQGLSQDDLPQTLYIISDMEFNYCVTGGTNFDNAKRKFEAAGYTLPNVVFWQVNARGNNTPVQHNQAGVALVSGFSPVIFKLAVENKSPYEVMMDTISSPRYEPIKL